jgi:hypothetical protein
VDPRQRFADLGEHDCALFGERLVEHNSVVSGDEPNERITPRLERTLAQIVAVEVS